MQLMLVSWKWLNTSYYYCLEVFLFLSISSHFYKLMSSVFWGGWCCLHLTLSTQECKRAKWLMLFIQEQHQVVLTTMIKVKHSNLNGLKIMCNCLYLIYLLLNNHDGDYTNWPCQHKCKEFRQCILAVQN